MPPTRWRVDSKTLAASSSNRRRFQRHCSQREYQDAAGAGAKAGSFADDRSALSDRCYYYEQFRRSEFDFDSQSARPYFPYDRVQLEFLMSLPRFFQVTFSPVQRRAVWDPSVTALDVFDGDRQLGRFYLDMHPRAGKDKWFSSFSILDGKKGKQLPEAALDLQFLRRKARRSGTDGVQRCDHVLPRVWSPDALDLPGATAVGRVWEQSGERLRRSSVADAGRVDARSQSAGHLCAQLPDQPAHPGRDGASHESRRRFWTRTVDAGPTGIHQRLLRSA